MLSKQALENLTPYGYTTKVLDAQKISREGVMVALQFKHNNPEFKEFQLELMLPFAKDNFIIMDGLERAILPQITEVGVRNAVEVASDMLQVALEQAMADFVYHDGPKPASEVVMEYFRRTVATSPLAPTTPHLPLERIGFGQMVRLDTQSGNPIDVSWRQLRKEHLGIIDPTSTSQGRQINRVFRKVVDKEHGLSEVQFNNAVGLKYVPRRAFLLRTAFERHLTQLVPETPLVVNKNNELSGKNGLTALMELGTLTHEDSIAVSQSFAAAMACRVEVVQTEVMHKPLETVVKIGDQVEPGQIVAKSVDGENYIRAKKIHYPSRLVSIEGNETHKFQRPAWRYWFRFEAETTLRTGDKISGRHGNKGIAEVIPDEDMPVLGNYVSTDGIVIPQRVDVVMSSLSVFKRRQMSLLWEMMAAKKALEEGKPIELGPWEVPDDLEFEHLVEQGYGKKQQVWLHGKELPELTFVGPLYWLRLDKLARREASAHKGGTIWVNHLGLPVNRARANGQRRDFAKSAAMYHRRMHKLLQYLIRENTKGIRKFELLVQGVEPDFGFEDLGRAVM